MIHIGELYPKIGALMDEKKQLALSEAYMDGRHSFEYIAPASEDTFHDKLQAPTPSENALKSSLVATLNATGKTFEVSHQEILAIKVSTLKKTLKEHARLDLLPKKDKCLLIRPDFFCSKYGFAIEVDGSIHHKITHRAKRDELREYVYKALGIALFRIDNDQVHRPQAKALFLKDITHWITQVELSPTSKNDYSSRRKKLSEARTLFRQINPQRTPLLGTFNSLNPKQAKYPTLPNKTTVQFAGYRIQINPTRKK